MGKLNNKNYPGFTYIRSVDGISEFVLKKNNLSVLIKEEHSAPVATFMVTYCVGSRDEAVGYTGSTHILEHMMFKESKNYPRNYWTTLFDKGAMQNATTWLDRTNYYQTLPIEYLEETIGYEADRMRSAIFKKEDLKTEMTVVRNEFERGENDPMEALDKNIWATAYQAHPYHHSTIGWHSDIENATVERLKNFYDTFYWPNNATVTLIGDIKTKEALSIIGKYFSKVPHSPTPIPKMLTEEPKQEGPRRVTVKRSGEINIVGIAHKTPPALSSDTPAIMVLSMILANGKSSRLYSKLVDKSLASSVTTSANPFKDSSLITTYVRPTNGTSLEKIEKIVLEEYEKIKINGVLVEEVKRAEAKFISSMVFSRDGSYSTAGVLNESIAVGNWTFYRNLFDGVKKVKPADIKRVANKYLMEDSSTTGFFIAEKNNISMGN